MGVLHDLLGDLDVLGEGLAGGVDHNGGETAVDAGLAGLEIRAVVQVQGDGDVGALDDSSLHQLHQVGVVGVGAGALGNLQDQGGLQFLSSLGDALDNLHVVDVESADSVAAVIGFLEHLGSGNQCHNDSLLFLIVPSICPIGGNAGEGLLTDCQIPSFKWTKTIFF